MNMAKMEPYVNCSTIPPNPLTSKLRRDKDRRPEPRRAKQQARQKSSPCKIGPIQTDADVDDAVADAYASVVERMFGLCPTKGA